MPRGKSSQTEINNSGEPRECENVTAFANPLRIRLNLKRKEHSPVKEAAVKNYILNQENKENQIQLPKITLSVKKAPTETKLLTNSQTPIINYKNENSNTSKLNHQNLDGNAVKARRGRPPKYPQPSGSSHTVPKNNHSIFKMESASRLSSISSTFPTIKTPISPKIHTNLSPLTHTSSISLREQERFKALQNALPFHLSLEYEKLFNVEYNKPFESKIDAYERLLPFHIISHAEYQMPSLLDKVDIDSSFETLRKRYSDYCRNEREIKVPMEIQLLENRLNLEEERFLLQKLKSECLSKFNKIPQ